MATALIIIDVQVGILDGLSPPLRASAAAAALDETVLRLAALAGRAHDAGVPVVMVQHDGGTGHRLARGTPGWALRPELQPETADAIIHKQSCDSFFDTGLQAELAARGVTHLIVAGCMTQYCVDTACRRAVSEGFDVTLVRDGHMTVDVGGLTFEQIIAHHNFILDGFSAGAHAITARTCSDLLV